MLSVDVYYWANKSNGLCIFCHHESFYKASRVFCVDEIVSALHVLFCDVM